MERGGHGKSYYGSKGNEYGNIKSSKNVQNTAHNITDCGKTKHTLTQRARSKLGCKTLLRDSLEEELV
jgi:hypothetical protein